jgi:hypothetical protein
MELVSSARKVTIGKERSLFDVFNKLRRKIIYDCNARTVRRFVTWEFMIVCVHFLLVPNNIFVCVLN